MAYEKQDPEAGDEEYTFGSPQSPMTDDEKHRGLSMRKDSISMGDRRASVSQATVLRNPLAGMTQHELFADVSLFAREKGLEDIEAELRSGAMIAQSPQNFEKMDLSEGDKESLRREKTHRWSQPFMLYFMTSKSTVAADEQESDQRQFFARGQLSCKAWTSRLSMAPKSSTFTSLTFLLRNRGDAAC